jgi:hypothetical protein
VLVCLAPGQLIRISAREPVIVSRRGRARVVAIGWAGYRAAVANHGVAFVNGILDAKRWHGPRRPNLGADLAAGRYLTDLDRAA